MGVVFICLFWGVGGFREALMYSFAVRVAEAKPKPNLGLPQQLAECHSAGNSANYRDYTELFPNIFEYANGEHLCTTNSHCAARRRQDAFCSGRGCWLCPQPRGFCMSSS